MKSYPVTNVSNLATTFASIKDQVGFTLSTLAQVFQHQSAANQEMLMVLEVAQIMKMMIDKTFHALNTQRMATSLLETEAIIWS